MLKLRLLTGPRAGRQLRVSDTKPISIGRRKGRLRLHDSRVSKNHAEIYFANDLWILRDLGSANGTYVNRKRIEGLIELEPGDMVQMGRVLFKIVRCDGIGMDTPPALDDDLLDAAVPGIATAAGGAKLADDDLDLEDLFGDSSSEDRGDDSGVLPGINEPDAPVEQAEPVEAIDDALGLDEPKASYEPIETAFDMPVDDDDSFFDDLGEATDATSGEDVAVTQAQIEEEDPFLPTKSEDDSETVASDDTSDQISLDDESGMGSPSAGTTLLTTVSHDDLIGDVGEESAAENDVPESSKDQYEEDDEYEEDEEDEEYEEDEEDEEDEQAPALVGLHLEHAPPLQPETTERDEEAEAVLENEPDTIETEPAEGFDDLEFDGELVSLIADETAQGIDELVDETTAETIEEPAEQSTEEHDDPAMDDLIAELTDDSHAEQELVDEEPEPVAELEAAIQTEPEAVDESPAFDIDAAFDALSEGLDDSSVVPSINSQDEQSKEDTPAEAPQAIEPAAAATDETPAPLAGSQLDVDFIKDALAKLEENTPDQPADDAQPKAAAAPPVAEPPSTPHKPHTDTYLQSTPPGLNPTTIYPPVEPDSSRATGRDSSNKGMWFLTILLALIAVGGGGILIGQNIDRFIAGRDDTTSAPDTATPANPGDNITTPPDGDVVPAPAIEPKPDDITAGPTGPDPFAVGPGVIGADALDGLTRGSDDIRPLDPIRQPTNTNPTQPDPIRQPTQPNVATPGPTNLPPIVPGTDTPEPAIDQPPARIVFLVDASGSLVDSLPQMLVWLTEALQTIEPNEQFAIYFFKDGKPIAIKPEGLVSPKRDTIAQIQDNWLSPDAAAILPSGRSNPTQAIAQAMLLKPTDLYVLSDDAFGRHKGDTTAEQAIDLVKQTIGESDIRVHGVQFFYRSDQSILETLANHYDGTYEFVRERIVPDGDPIDLLEELGGE